MVTMQMQKTRNEETVTKTAIDQKQSLEVVQTMLHGGVSSLVRAVKWKVADSPMCSSAACHTYGRVGPE